MADVPEHEIPEKPNKPSWLWPAGAVATGFAGIALLLLRGCWHRRMSWPVRSQDYAYQVCLGCGVKRLFDEKNFRPYGPFHNDLNELIAWSNARQAESPVAPAEPPTEREEQRPAS